MSHDFNYLRLFDRVIALFESAQEASKQKDDGPLTASVLKAFGELTKALGIDRNLTWPENYQRLGMIERTGESLQRMARGAFELLEPTNRKSWGLRVIGNALINLWKQLTDSERIALDARYQKAISICVQILPPVAKSIVLTDDGRELTKEEAAQHQKEFLAAVHMAHWEVDACFSRWAEGDFEKQQGDPSHAAPSEPAPAPGCGSAPAARRLAAQWEQQHAGTAEADSTNRGKLEKELPGELAAKEYRALLLEWQQAMAKLGNWKETKDKQREFVKLIQRFWEARAAIARQYGASYSDFPDPAEIKDCFKSISPVFDRLIETGAGGDPITHFRQACYWLCKIEDLDLCKPIPDEAIDRYLAGRHERTEKQIGQMTWGEIALILKQDYEQRAGTGQTRRDEPEVPMSWQEAADRMERLRIQGKPFTSQHKLAELFGCSSGTINKAIQQTASLHCWAKRQNVAARKARSLNDAVMGRAAQSTEPDPNDQAAIREYLEGDLTPDERGFFNGLSLEDQIEFLNDPDKHDKILGRKP